MNELDYSAAGVPVRNDLKESHRRVWDHIRSPGTWWTGTERVAIAAEVRTAWACSLCSARKAALSPNAIQGEHDGERTLSANVVEVIHRVVTDQARLSKPWFDSVIAGGLSETHYVELIGIVTMVTGVDYFTRSLGIPLFPLPDPLPGKATRDRPASAKPAGFWVPMMAPAEVAGSKDNPFEGQQTVFNVDRALSLVPGEVRVLLELISTHYMSPGDVDDPSLHRDLDRAQTELVASRVSALVECFY